MERKGSTEHSVVFLQKQKVQVTIKDLIFVVGSMLRTGSAKRLSSQYFTAVPISNIAGLVPFGFFCPQPWFLRRSEHIFPRKTPVFIVINTVTCVTRVTSNWVEVHRLNSQHLAMVRTSNMAELVPSGISCLQTLFLQRNKHIYLNNTPVSAYVNPAAINKQLFKYKNYPQNIYLSQLV